MRIAAYNILDGGTGRADPLAEVLLAQRADIIVLAEAGDPEVVDRLSLRLKMDVAVGYGPQRGRGDAVAILSRWPLRETINHGLLHKSGPRALLEARVELGGRTVPVFAVHLTAHARQEDEQRRLGELDAVLSVTAALRSSSTPHVLAGDFNAISPRQTLDLAAVKESTRREAASQGGLVPRDAIARLLAAGYVDAFDASGGSTAAGTFSTQHPGQRVDFIFAHGLTATSAWIETDRLAKYASDHFPIGAELELP